MHPSVGPNTRLYGTSTEAVAVAIGTMTVVVPTVGRVFVTATSTVEKDVTEVVVMAAVGTSVTRTVETVEMESILTVSVSTSNSVVT